RVGAQANLDGGGAHEVDRRRGDDLDGRDVRDVPHCLGGVGVVHALIIPHARQGSRRTTTAATGQLPLPPPSGSPSDQLSPSGCVVVAPLSPSATLVRSTWPRPASTFVQYCKNRTLTFSKVSARYWPTSTSWNRAFCSSPKTSR